MTPPAVTIAVLYPRYDHPAIEERYASWQSQMLLRQGEGQHLVLYYKDHAASKALAAVEEEHVLVITDPLVIPSRRLGTRLLRALLESGAAAALPVSNESEHPLQKRPAAVPYLTLRELELVLSQMERSDAPLERTIWDRSDPAAYLCRTELLAESREPLRNALSGRDVAISPSDYIHRWASLRGQVREDLLARIDLQARSVLEFGCGEASLGQALKARQKCRVVGVELDPEAAAVAKKRIDAVFSGDVQEIVSILNETFDWIVGGDIVEHLAEPWPFLAELRRLCRPGGHLLLSLPNIANASIINDLLQGRFDYVYMGLTCVGHLRFFTRRSIEEMLTIAGWTVAEVIPQEVPATLGHAELLQSLRSSGVSFSEADLMPGGYYVIARNGSGSAGG